MKIDDLTVQTTKRNEMVLLTEEINSFLRGKGYQNGKLTLFVPHTTAAVTINENADPDVQRDMLNGLNKISPNLPEFTHYEGNSDAHIKSSLIGCSQDILVNNGRLILGTWQGIYFCEFDGPRQRRLIIGFEGR